MPDVKISPATIVIGLAGILILGAFGWLTFGPKPAPPPPPVLTQEARQYLPNLQLANVHMQAAESYVNSRLIEILGDIVNTGDRNVKSVLVTCVFRNFGNQEIARERVYVVNERGGVLKPKDTKPFRLPFDNVPNTWNEQMPTLVIAEIQFE